MLNKVFVNLRRHRSVLNLQMKPMKVFDCQDTEQAGMTEFVNKQVLVDEIIELIQSSGKEVEGRTVLIAAIKEKFDS